MEKDDDYNIKELGGFAEDLNAIDGDEKDFEAFNYCLAYDYFCAVKGEDFDSLGKSLNNSSNWYNIMMQVNIWLSNTDDEEISEEELDKLLNGTILTYKNRTFIEACYEHGWKELADSFVKENKNLNKVTKRIKERDDNNE